MENLCDAFAATLMDVGDIAAEPDILDDIRRRLFDTAGVAAAGYASSGVAQSRSVFSATEQFARLSAVVRASEADDIHIGCCVTPASIVIPVVLALASELGVSDGTAARAIVIGYEAAVRLGLAINGAERVYNGIWPSFFVAPVAAAAAAISMFAPWNREMFGDAVALAATRISGGSWLPPEPSARWLMFGSAVAEGVRAARVASAGLKGDRRFVGMGLSRILAVELNQEALLASSAPAIQSTDCKPFPVARQVLSAVQAVSEAASKANDITPDKIIVRLPRQYRLMVDQPAPSPEMAIASVQLQIAVALSARAMLFGVARHQALEDPAVRTLMGRITVMECQHLTDLYPRHWAAEVDIISGPHSYSSRVLDPAGARQGGFGWPDILEKLMMMGRQEDEVLALHGLVQDFANSDQPMAAAIGEWIECHLPDQ